MNLKVIYLSLSKRIRRRPEKQLKCTMLVYLAELSDHRATLILHSPLGPQIIFQEPPDVRSKGIIDGV